MTTTMKDLVQRFKSDLRWRFPPELRTMSIIPRWSVVHTQIVDSVAAHSFHTTFYARETAILIDWKGDLGDLMYLAMTHDTDEIVTGDVIGPAKREIIDKDKAERYLRGQLVERMPFVVSDVDEINSEPNADEAWRIIKFADRLDALIFLMTERRLGNGVVAPHIPRCMHQVELAWRRLPCDVERLDEMWHTIIIPAIEAHHTAGGAGLAI